jgi:alpha-galactosidase
MIRVQQECSTKGKNCQEPLPLRGWFQVLAQPNAPLGTLKLKGLDPNLDYGLADTSHVYGGDVLMNAGIALPAHKGDFQSAMWRFRAGCID